MVDVPLIVGTPVWVYGHVGVLGAVDTDGVEGGVMPLSGVSKLITGAEGFGISAAEGGLRPALPISVAPMGMPTGPTGDPGVDVEAVAAAAAPPPPIGAQGPDALAVMPPPAALVPMPPPLSARRACARPAASGACSHAAAVERRAARGARYCACHGGGGGRGGQRAAACDPGERIKRRRAGQDRARARRCELGRAQGNSRRPDWPSRTDAERRRYAQRQSGRDAGRLCLRGAAAQERRRQRHRKTYHHGFGLVLAERSRSPGATRKPM